MGTKFYKHYRSFVNVDLALNATEHLTNAEVNDIVDRAAARYSVAVPQRKTLRVTGDGTNRYALPTDWETDYSRIVMIEFPDRTQEISKIRIINFRIHDNGDGGGEKIHLMNTSPSSSDTFTVHYLIPHGVTATASTVSDADFQAVGYLVASFTCLSLAGRMLRSRSANQNLEAVNFRTLSDEYRSLAKEYFTEYKGLMGLPDKGPLAAQFIGDMDIEPPWLIGGYMTHGRR